LQAGRAEVIVLRAEDDADLARLPRRRPQQRQQRQCEFLALGGGPTAQRQQIPGAQRAAGKASGSAKPPSTAR